MKSIIERLKQSIEFAEKEGENMDDISWEMQEGILISYNEAKKILAVIDSSPQTIEDHTEKLKAFADFLGVRIWEQPDKDLSEFVDEFLSTQQTIEDHEANSVRGVEAYTDQGEKRKVKAVTDDSGHWYVIPNEMLNEFMQDEQNENMVDSGEFGAKWDEYRTGGDLNLVQLWSEL